MLTSNSTITSTGCGVTYGTSTISTAPITWADTTMVTVTPKDFGTKDKKEEKGMDVKLGTKKRYEDLAVGDIFKIKVDEDDILCIKTGIRDSIDNTKKAIRLDSGTELTPMGDDIVTKVNAKIHAEE